jgi:hypothetical protein
MRITIDDILHSFFLTESFGKKGTAYRRIRFVELSLRDHLEESGSAILTTWDRALLALEVLDEPYGAFCRTMHADDLVFALPGYLRLSPLDDTDRRTQLRVVEHLVAFIKRCSLIDEDDMACPLLEVGAAILHGRRALAGKES